jgi:hypothetical protein
MKMMSIKIPPCFSEEHGCIPVMQTSKLLACPTCYKATKLWSMYKHSRMCGVKCLQYPQLMGNLDKTRRIKKADQSWRMEDPKKKMLNLVKTKERIMKHQNPFGGEKPNKYFGHASTICWLLGPSICFHLIFFFVEGSIFIFCGTICFYILWNVPFLCFVECFSVYCGMIQNLWPEFPKSQNSLYWRSNECSSIMRVKFSSPVEMFLL